MRNPGRFSTGLLLGSSLILTGCGQGIDATPASIATAETKWKAAGIRNYDLEWTNSGMGNGHYRVFVRDGEVKAIYSRLPDGREVIAKPGQPRFYSIDGLFLTIKDELAQLKTDNPFGQPKRTSAILKFTPDPQLGYPKSYRRDVMGTPKGVSIDVIKLDQSPATEISPPATAASSQ
jgi:hypothetical protein